MHYKRWWKTGDPFGTLERTIPPQTRFWSHVAKSETCWTWTAARNSNGYGNFSPMTGSWSLAHRYSWELEHGAIPRGLWVLHRCDNPPCVRPAHLFLGDHQSNVADMISKRRHMHGERHWKATLTDDQVSDIRSRLTGQRGEIVALAQEYNVSRMAIQHIRDGQRRAEPTQFQ
jgi:hypothetical protein